MKHLWRPIVEMTEAQRRSTDLLLRAPELVDLDCNEHGIGMGYYLDEVGWLAAKWSMQSDMWNEERVTPTHFIVMEGPQ